MSKSFRFWLVHPLVDFKMLSKYDGIPVYVGLGPDNNAKICGYFVDLQCPLPTQTNLHMGCLKYICTVYRPIKKRFYVKYQFYVHFTKRLYAREMLEGDLVFIINSFQFSDILISVLSVLYGRSDVIFTNIVNIISDRAVLPTCYRQRIL